MTTNTLDDYTEIDGETTQPNRSVTSSGGTLSYTSNPNSIHSIQVQQITGYRDMRDPVNKGVSVKEGAIFQDNLSPNGTRFWIATADGAVTPTADGFNGTEPNWDRWLQHLSAENAIQFVGSSGDRRLLGITVPLLSNDATNKSYVDIISLNRFSTDVGVNPFLLTNTTNTDIRVVGWACSGGGGDNGIADAGQTILITTQAGNVTLTGGKTAFNPNGGLAGTVSGSVSGIITVAGVQGQHDSLGGRGANLATSGANYRELSAPSNYGAGKQSVAVSTGGGGSGAYADFDVIVTPGNIFKVELVGAVLGTTTTGAFQATAGKP